MAKVMSVGDRTVTLGIWVSVLGKPIPEEADLFWYSPFLSFRPQFKNGGSGGSRKLFAVLGRSSIT